MMDLPPLLRELVSKETKEENPMMKVKLNESLFSNSRLAKEGEVPDIKIKIGLGTPHPNAKSLYEGLNIK